MAVAIIGGTITSTLLTLLVVPSFYDRIEICRDRAVAKFRRRVGALAPGGGVPADARRGGADAAGSQGGVALAEAGWGEGVADDQRPARPGGVMPHTQERASPSCRRTSGTLRGHAARFEPRDFVAPYSSTGAHAGESRSSSGLRPAARDLNPQQPSSSRVRYAPQEEVIAQHEALRPTLGEAVVDAALAVWRGVLPRQDRAGSAQVTQ